MIAGSVSDHPEIVRHPPGIEEGVLPAAAIYGANASGKTNLLRAMQFVQTAVRDSQARWQPGQPIALEPFAGKSDVPSSFSVDFLLDSVRYQYGFTALPQAILKEWLYAYPSGKKQTWFLRERNKPISFSQKLQGENRTIERLTRPNSLFLSAGAQNNHKMLSRIYKWFSQWWLLPEDEQVAIGQTARVLHGRSDLQRGLGRMLSLADLGITDMDVQTSAVPAPAKEALEKLAELLKAPEITSRVEEEMREVRFFHRIGDAPVAFRVDQESKGTVAFFCLLLPVLVALTTGAVVWADELDRSLHPLLALDIIRMFTVPGNNRSSAQLIFNTHDTNLLSAGVLRRDQIWFTEKLRDGASRLYPLTDFKPRKEENLENGYLQGRYGAIPFLNGDRFLAAIHEEK